MALATQIILATLLNNIIIGWTIELGFDGANGHNDLQQTNVRSGEQIILSNSSHSRTNHDNNTNLWNIDDPHGTWPTQSSKKNYTRTRRRSNDLSRGPSLYSAPFTKKKRSVNVFMIEHFKEEIVNIGSNVSLQCIAKSEVAPIFHWEKDGEVISPEVDERYSIDQTTSPSGLSVESRLNISSVGSKDRGLYSCIAVVGDSSSTYMAVLDISNKKSVRRKREMTTGNIMMTQHFSDEVVSPGNDISLQCTATSERPPRFIWERDGVVITPNTDSRYTLGQMISPSGLGVVSNVNISRARVEDGGFYSCTAIEGESSTTHVARLNVYGSPYIRALPHIKVQSGESLKVRCPYYGYPISKLEWEHKGKKIVSTTLSQRSLYKRSLAVPESLIKSKRKRKKRHTYTPSEDGVLNIPRIVKEDNGDTYTCVVYSPSGEMARRSFEIQVVEAPELDELRVGTGLKEGQIVQITCNIISGDPPIYFSWLKDGKKIPSNLKITERSSELFSVLIIKKVGLEHCGRYTCVATNHVGKNNQTASLYINGIAVIST